MDDETHQNLAERALLELLNNDPDRDDLDEVTARNRRALVGALFGRPMTRENARTIADYLRQRGWREDAIADLTAERARPWWRWRRIVA
jgi:hypothetical protein